MSIGKATALAPKRRYDALKFIDDEALGEMVYPDWDDDVFEVPG